MHSYSSSAPGVGRIVWRVLFCCALAVLLGLQLDAQSTFGSILGTVHDGTGAVVTTAHVTLTNTGTSAKRMADSDAQGNYAFKNIDVGHYKLTIAAPGFASQSLPELSLTARETLRMDATLQPGAENETVVVMDNVVPVISTDVSNLAETKVGEELVVLPVAVYARSTGSTSPISPLTTEAGVQTDDSGDLAVMGTTPALLSVTIDGISSVGVEYSGPVNEMFPSFNSIEEIRVSESNNNAEFSGVADITTVSKAGTSHFHGGVFENHENTVLNSGVPTAFASSKPKIIMNDFGGTLGGPLHLPLLHEAADKNFFFISYEALRLPRETAMTLSTPSAAMRSGDLTSYLTQSYCPNEGDCPNGYNLYGPDGTLLTNTLAPQVVAPSATTTKLLNVLFPTANYGAADSFSNNYQLNMPTPIAANQGDVRIDRVLTGKQTIFARFSYKNRQVVTAPSPSCIASYCAEAGSPLMGGFNTPEIDEGLTVAHNYVFSSTLMNEFRGGFNAQHTSESQSFKSKDILEQTGLLGVTPQVDTDWSEAPEMQITGLLATGAGNPGMQRGQIVEVLDNLTWSHGRHGFKFGADLKRLTDHDENLFGNYRSGWFVFNGSTSVITGASTDLATAEANGTATGDPYSAFLFGYPDYTEVSTSSNPKVDGHGYNYAVYAQDDWKITPRLTLNLGLRYELHPPIRERHSNSAAFDPDYSSTVNGSIVKGAVVVSDNKALSEVSTDFATSIDPTPVVTAATAGIPSGLRYTYKAGIAPRIGFAWRLYGNDKTVLRGGWGRFMETPMGFALYAGAAVSSSFLGTYDQSVDASGTPALTWANPYNAATVEGSGAAIFNYAFPIHYKDPSVQQWNLTLEQDMGHGMGLRLSYTGSHGSNLEAMADLNQVPANTAGYSAVEASRPYTSWAIIQSVVNAAESNYHSGTVELSRHSGKGITFDANYTWTRDLSNASGAVPTAFAVAGGSWISDRYHPGVDYGNVIFDRRHRLLATGLYQLPFGHGTRWLNQGTLLNQIVGNWQIGGVVVMQSGAFLTPYQESTDPAGTNVLVTESITRADSVAHVSPYMSHRTAGQWLNPSAFSIPADNIGRFGNAGVGSVVGPGTANLSLSLTKDFTLYAKSKLEVGVEAANVLNHRNYETPNMQVDATGSFGTITALQSAEGAGPRSLQLTGRINF